LDGQNAYPQNTAPLPPQTFTLPKTGSYSADATLKKMKKSIKLTRFGFRVPAQQRLIGNILYSFLRGNVPFPLF
jgi:hypothetical protein